MFNGVEHLISSDSTVAFVSSKGKPALNSTLKEEINACSSGSLITINNGGNLDATRASEPLGHCSTRCRVIVWNGNELCERLDGIRRR
eukprot:5659290-Pyramimonas_sp.AAC.1